jgi:hypothetical protein
MPDLQQLVAQRSESLDHSLPLVLEALGNLPGGGSASWGCAAGLQFVLQSCSLPFVAASSTPVHCVAWRSSMLQHAVMPDHLDSVPECVAYQCCVLAELANSNSLFVQTSEVCRMLRRYTPAGRSRRRAASWQWAAAHPPPHPAGAASALAHYKPGQLHDAFHWAYAATKTRTVLVPAVDSLQLEWAPEVGALVPLLDLANHASGGAANAMLAVRFGEAGISVGLIAARDIEPGEQVGGLVLRVWLLFSHSRDIYGCVWACLGPAAAALVSKPVFDVPVCRELACCRSCRHVLGGCTEAATAGLPATGCAKRH